MINGGRRAKKPIHYELLRERFGHNRGEKWHQGYAISRGDELREAPQFPTAMVPISVLISNHQNEPSIAEIEHCNSGNCAV
jgi:hypothetical protein